jgi:MSHA biogenesis protein MshP
LDQQGFAAIAAIFLVVILAAMGAFMVSFSNTQQLTSSQDVQGTRAYWAARAGLEWGVGSVVASTTAGTTLPVCPTLPTPSPTTLATAFDGGFTVKVTCNHNDYIEGSASANKFIFEFTSEAKVGSVGTIGYVERSVSASLECQSNATAPLYTCG